MNIFLQLGATRDGLDPYLRVAHMYGMSAALIETPDYIQLRKELGRKEFDHTLAVKHPSNLEEVLAALNASGLKPVYVLAGFERYIYTAYGLAQQLHLPPYQNGQRFFPPDKGEQRSTFARYPDLVLQPGYCILEDGESATDKLASLQLPVVLKPMDGGGGLGVFLITQRAALETALHTLQTLRNYDGGLFKGALIEEFLPGTEYSVQGMVMGGHCVLLTFCKKFTLAEPLPGSRNLYSFREVGHMAMVGGQVPPTMYRLVQHCIDILGYEDGPFHADIVCKQGKYYVLELGFRLSGSGLAQIVEQVSGYDWATEVFAAHLGRCFSAPQPSASVGVLGQITAISEQELIIARSLQQKGYAIQIQLFNPASPSFAQSLTSDLVRHGGFLGRIYACGQKLEEVEKLLQYCSPTRTRIENMPVARA